MIRVCAKNKLARSRSAVGRLVASLCINLLTGNDVWIFKFLQKTRKNILPLFLVENYGRKISVKLLLCKFQRICVNYYIVYMLPTTCRYEDIWGWLMIIRHVLLLLAIGAVQVVTRVGRFFTFMKSIRFQS